MANTRSVKKIVPEAEQNAPETIVESKVEAPAKPVVKEVDLHELITVRNGFQGKLVYISKRTGEKFVWDHFGDEQDMELGELRNAKSSAKAFFENNWFMFDDRWVVDYLGMSRFYKYAVNIDDFDGIFTMSPDEIEKVVGNMSSGQKRSLLYRSKALIAENEIDSNKVIAALEKCLDTQLVER